MRFREFAVLLGLAAWPATAAAAAAPASGLAEAIQGYGLIQSYGYGYGGMVIVKFEPAILFRSGEILTDIKAVADPARLEADRRARPERWSRWRQTAGVYEYATRSGKWARISGNQVWSIAPVTTALRGVFEHVGGGGNLALGGTSGVFTQTTYEFQPGGRLIRRGLAAAASEAQGGGAGTRTTGAAHSERAGRYSVEGLLMKVAYEDGGQDSLVFMTHPTDPDIIWLNGMGFTRAK